LAYRFIIIAQKRAVLDYYQPNRGNVTMRNRLIVLILVLATGLSACASLTPQQCLSGDWQNIGFGDGVAGRAPDYINAHRDACSEVGIVPDFEAWLRGRAAGLQRYCSPENAYIIGRNGNRVSPVCSPDQRASMSYAYDWGLQYYELDQQIREAESEIDRIESVILAELSLPELTPEQADRKARLLFQIRRLESDIRMAELRQRRYAQLPY